ncbi:hypothetical protein [Kitasatospora sp. NPDC047058]|uniref:hypothetical protein n=1 Tax=Kitasatospora sp. NPDC047058 TaxID=3155620 RepID=UPI0033FAD323
MTELPGKDHLTVELTSTATVEIAIATHSGSAPAKGEEARPSDRETLLNCDAAAVHTVPHTGIVGVGLVDGIGHSDDLADYAKIAAEVMARVGSRTTASLGLLNASSLNNTAPPGTRIVIDGVGMCAVVLPDGQTGISGTGDCRAHGWHPDRGLRSLTDDQTMGAYLRSTGIDPDFSQPFDAWPQTSLGRCTPSSIARVQVDDPLVLLSTDGVHDRLTPDTIAALVTKHAGDLRALATALVTPDEPALGQEIDDATVIILRHLTATP